MRTILIIASKTEQISELSSGLAEKGFSCSVTANGDSAIEQVLEQNPDLILLDLHVSPAIPSIRNLSRKINQKRSLPIIALLSSEQLGILDFSLDVDDFVALPPDINEVIARINLAFWRTDNITNDELIKCGDLVIDRDRALDVGQLVVGAPRYARERERGVGVRVARRCHTEPSLAGAALSVQDAWDTDEHGKTRIREGNSMFYRRDAEGAEEIGNPLRLCVLCDSAVE